MLIYANNLSMKSYSCYQNDKRERCAQNSNINTQVCNYLTRKKRKVFPEP